MKIVKVFRRITGYVIRIMIWLPLAVIGLVAAGICLPIWAAGSLFCEFQEVMD